MLAFYVAARIHQTVLSKSELQRFKLQLSTADKPAQLMRTSSAPDFSLWSERRIKDYEESLAAHFNPAIAILRIPRIKLEVPVMEGTDDLILNRGVGHVAHTANPGENGNSAIAGHRDGFFRGLKDVGLGDTIELVTPQRTVTYLIDRIRVVDPSDVSVLQPTASPTLTLVTCYPFYFLGSAPKRYIVQASATPSGSRMIPPPGSVSAGPGRLDQQAVTRSTVSIPRKGTS